MDDSIVLMPSVRFAVKDCIDKMPYQSLSEVTTGWDFEGLTHSKLNPFCFLLIDTPGIVACSTINLHLPTPEYAFRSAINVSINDKIFDNNAFYANEMIIILFGHW